METPWEVVGFEKVVSQSGKDGVRLYCQRDLISADASGKEVGRFYFMPEKLDYSPVLGQRVILLVEGNFIQRVILVA